MATNPKTTASRVHHPKGTSAQLLKPTITVRTVKTVRQHPKPSIPDDEFDATLDRIIQCDRELLERLA